MPSSVTTSLSLSTVLTVPILPLTPSRPSVTTTLSPSLMNQSFILYFAGTLGGFTTLAENVPKNSSLAVPLAPVPGPAPAAAPPVCVPSTCVPATVAYAAAARHGASEASSQSSRRALRASLIVRVFSLAMIEFARRYCTRSRIVRFSSRMRAFRLACDLANAVRRRTRSMLYKVVCRVRNADVLLHFLGQRLARLGMIVALQP